MLTVTNDRYANVIHHEICANLPVRPVGVPSRNNHLSCGRNDGLAIWTNKANLNGVRPVSLIRTEFDLESQREWLGVPRK